MIRQLLEYEGLELRFSADTNKKLDSTDRMQWFFVCVVKFGHLRHVHNFCV